MNNKVDSSSDRLTAANRVVKNHAIASIVAGAIPLPLLDIGIIFGVQLKMIHQLCEIYKTPFSDELGRAALTSLISSGGAVTLGTPALRSLARSLSKFIPVVGTAAGIAGASSLSYATTLALGNVFIQHFETGGTLLTLNAEKIEEHYKQDGKESGVDSTEKPPNYLGIKP